MFSESQVTALASNVSRGAVPDLILAVQGCGFDVAAYLADHPDLQSAGLDFDSALHHFLVHGYAEPRLVSAAFRPTALDALNRIQGIRPAYLTALRRSLVRAAVRNRGADWEPAERMGDVGRLVREVGMRPCIIAGDSHSYVYAGSGGPPAAALAPIHLPCSAGSAMGLGNAASRSQYGARLIAWFETASDALRRWRVPVFLKFGQVDTEFVFVFQRIREGRSAFALADFESFARRSVQSYFIFIDNLRGHLDRELLRVCSIFPPVLSDEAWGQGYVNAHINFLEGDRDPAALAAAIRGIEIPSLAVRTHLHALYNAELQQECTRRMLTFVDDFSTLLGAGGVIDQRFMAGHAGDDHHVAGPAVHAEVGDILAQYSSGETRRRWSSIRPFR